MIVTAPYLHSVLGSLDPCLCCTFTEHTTLPPNYFVDTPHMQNMTFTPKFFSWFWQSDYQGLLYKTPLHVRYTEVLHTWIYRVFVLSGQGAGNTESCMSGLLHEKFLTTSSELVTGTQCTAEGSRQEGRRSTRSRAGAQVAITESPQKQKRGTACETGQDWRFNINATGFRCI